MRNFFSHHRRTLELSAFACGILSSTIACGLLIAHAQLFQNKRALALDIGMQLPELESSVALLRANTEAEALFFESGLASREELADVYILPLTSPVPRFISSVNAVSHALSLVSVPLTIEKVIADPSSQVADGVKSYSAHLTLRGSFQAISRFLGIFSFSGDMMVKDVLPSDAENTLLRAIESIAPLTLRSSEEFLYTDLLEYVSDPDRVEQRMFTDVPTETASELRSVLLRGGLAHARMALQDIAKSVRDKRVWPFPLMSFTGLRREGERWMVDVTVYGR